MSESTRNELVKLGFLCEAALRSADAAISAGNDKFYRRAAAFHLHSAELYSAMAFKAVQP